MESPDGLTDCENCDGTGKVKPCCGSSRKGKKKKCKYCVDGKIGALEAPIYWDGPIT